MSLQFIIGSSGIGKTHYACQQIIQESLENPGKLYYIIVPEQFTMQTQKNVVEMHPGKGILNIDVLSFQRLAYRVFEEVGGAREVLLDDTGKSLVLQKLVQQHKKELPYLGSQMNKPGYLDEVKSLIFLLLSIVLWFFGYNAVTSKYSVYASNILHKDYNLTLIIAQAAAIISYLPVGFIASRVGRKKTILAGVVMLTAAFTTAAFMSAESPTMLMNAMFALAGVAWATINVNSFPMVVEMCSGGNVGKYTGFYYTASMAAQVATPMLSGLLMDRMGMHVLFPYAAVFTALAFVTMLFVRHGDSKPEAKLGLEALDEMED